MRLFVWPLSLSRPLDRAWLLRVRRASACGPAFCAANGRVSASKIAGLRPRGRNLRCHGDRRSIGWCAANRLPEPGEGETRPGEVSFRSAITARRRKNGTEHGAVGIGDVPIQGKSLVGLCGQGAGVRCRGKVRPDGLDLGFAHPRRIGKIGRPEPGWKCRSAGVDAGGQRSDVPRPLGQVWFPLLLRSFRQTARRRSSRGRNLRPPPGFRLRKEVGRCRLGGLEFALWRAFGRWDPQFQFPRLGIQGGPPTEIAHRREPRPGGQQCQPGQSLSQ